MSPPAHAYFIAQNAALLRELILAAHLQSELQSDQVDRPRLRLHSLLNSLVATSHCQRGRLRAHLRCEPRDYRSAHAWHCDLHHADGLRREI